MQWDRPFRIVTPTLDGDVLAALGRVEASFTPPQLQRVLGRHSEDGVRKALHRLADQGVLTRSRIGRADVFSLNRDHIAAPHLIAIARLREELLARMRNALEAWAVPCEYAALFGSAAGGEMRPDSDVDLFVVRPLHVKADDDDWREQLFQFTHQVGSWAGNDVRPLEMGAGDVTVGLMDRREPVLDEIRHYGIWLFGEADYLVRGQAP